MKPTRIHKDGQALCALCDAMKPEEEFRPLRNPKSRSGRHSYCRDCERRFDRERMQRRRANKRAAQEAATP